MQTVGKNKRRQIETYDNVHGCALSVDSPEECDFIAWLCEAYQLGIIRDFQYQPESFLLFSNEKYVDIFGKSRTLFQNHQYSCDFIVKFDPKKWIELSKEFKVFQNQLDSEEVSVYIDTKGTFNRNSRSFSTDRKWVWQKYNIYVLEIVPQKFFMEFGVPSECFLSKKT